jgi:hypothetical protein
VFHFLSHVIPLVVNAVIANCADASAFPRFDSTAPGPDFGTPPIPAFLFLETRFELIPAPLQLRGFCFLGSALEPLGSLRECSRSLWEQ